MEARNEEVGVPVTAVVLATGALSAKGRLVRDILYPSSIVFVFIEQLKVVFPILLLWGIIMLAVSIRILQADPVNSWFYGMFTISQVLSPLLPAVLIIGQSISAKRLASKGIMCVDFSRITLAGKVKVFCFDKTGTMTKEGLDFIGVHEVDLNTNSFSDTNKQNDYNLLSMLTKQAMQTCHFLSLANGCHVGNFVDMEMFRATGAKLDPTSSYAINPSAMSGTNPMRVVKRFEFVHAHAYMSVVAQDIITDQYYVFIKGSFEQVVKLTTNTPSDLVSCAKSHAKVGCYVVAVAYREYPAHTSIQEIEKSTRQEIQQGCTILGLLLFRNELKMDTCLAIEELRRGGCRPVMVTGDHALTAIHVGHESGLILADKAAVILVDLIDRVPVGTNVISLETYDMDVLNSELRRHPSRYELVITGAAFNFFSNTLWVQKNLQGI